jgi:predicted ATPase
LEWLEKGEKTPFKAHFLSEGTINFICLVTVLLQPEELQSDIILFDGPEVGLHPFAINLLASILSSTSKSRQIIITTQSIELLNRFTPDDVVVTDRLGDGNTHLHRLDPQALGEWLGKFSLGELWNKNLLGGRPD